MAICLPTNSDRLYGIISHEQAGEWPSFGYHTFKCFELVSAQVPTTWRVLVGEDSNILIFPEAWQDGLLEKIVEHDPEAYPIFDRERNIMLQEDP